MQFLKHSQLPVKEPFLPSVSLKALKHSVLKLSTNNLMKIKSVIYF